MAAVKELLRSEADGGIEVSCYTTSPPPDIVFCIVYKKG